VKYSKDERAQFVRDLRAAGELFAAGTSESELMDSHASLMSRYSFANVCRILSQNPNASVVAGFRQWEESGRNVAKGSKAIYILAPMARKNDDGDMVKVGFRCVAVFDISQTIVSELALV